MIVVVDSDGDDGDGGCGCGSIGEEAAVMVVVAAAGWRNSIHAPCVSAVRESGFGCARGATPTNRKRAGRRRAVGRPR